VGRCFKAEGLLLSLHERILFRRLGRVVVEVWLALERVFGSFLRCSLDRDIASLILSSKFEVASLEATSELILLPRLLFLEGVVVIRSEALGLDTHAGGRTIDLWREILHDLRRIVLGDLLLQESERLREI